MIGKWKLMPPKEGLVHSSDDWRHAMKLRSNKQKLDQWLLHSSRYIFFCIYFFAFLFCYMLSQVFVYVCSNVWTWCIGNSQFFLFKAADTCICCCFGASAPGNLGWKHLYLLWGPRHLYLFRGPRYLNLGSHLTLQSLVPLVHLDVVQLELLLITDHLQRNSIII